MATVSIGTRATPVASLQISPRATDATRAIDGLALLRKRQPC